MFFTYFALEIHQIASNTQRFHLQKRQNPMIFKENTVVFHPHRIDRKQHSIPYMQSSFSPSPATSQMPYTSENTCTPSPSKSSLLLSPYNHVRQMQHDFHLLLNSLRNAIFDPFSCAATVAACKRQRLWKSTLIIITSRLRYVPSLNPLTLFIPSKERLERSFRIVNLKIELLPSLIQDPIDKIIFHVETRTVQIQD